MIVMIVSDMIAKLFLDFDPIWIAVVELPMTLSMDGA